MAYRYKKPYRIKRKRSILRNRFFWLGLLVLTVVGGISYVLFFSGIFQIEKIVVDGERKVSQEDIKFFVPKDNLFFVDVQKIRRDILSNFPKIAEVEIRRGFPDALNILVAERLAVALWCEGENCFLVDNDGVIFGEVLIPSEVEGLMKITGAKELLLKEKISQILNIEAKLEEGLLITAARAFIATEERLNIETSEGWEIYFNLKGDLEWQIQELNLVLEKQIPKNVRKNLEYIDLRFSRVYYK